MKRHNSVTIEYLKNRVAELEATLANWKRSHDNWKGYATTLEQQENARGVWLGCPEFQIVTKGRPSRADIEAMIELLNLFLKREERRLA